IDHARRRQAGATAAQSSCLDCAAILEPHNGERDRRRGEAWHSYRIRTSRPSTVELRSPNPERARCALPTGRETPSRGWDVTSEIPDNLAKPIERGGENGDE